MNKITLIAGGVLLAGTGAALAQPSGGARFDRDADLTRQQAVERADRRFAGLDLDNDGRVTADEARQAREQRRGDRAGRAFDRFDANDDGSVSREEFSQARAERGQRPGEGRRGRGGIRGGHMFGEQGFVTREQMRERALARFDRLDANRDGTLTADERRQGREHRRGRRGG